MYPLNRPSVPPWAGRPFHLQPTSMVSKVVFNSVSCLCPDNLQFIPMLPMIFFPSNHKDLTLPAPPHKRNKCLEEPFFIIQTLNGRCKMRGSCNRSEHGVDHTSQKLIQNTTQYLWGGAVGCVFLMDSQGMPTVCDSTLIH